jgi:hypothetical protein
VLPYTETVIYSNVLAGFGFANTVGDTFSFELDNLGGSGTYTASVIITNPTTFNYDDFV